MKPRYIKSAIYLMSLLMLLTGFYQCYSESDNSFQEILRSIDSYKVIDTHEHQHDLSDYGYHEYNFYHILSTSDLASDLNSIGAPKFNLKNLDSLNNEQLWNLYGKFLDYSRATSYYSQFVKGFNKLYELNDLYFTEENIQILSTKINRKYMMYDQWFDTVFNSLGFEIMFVDQYWKPFNVEVDTNHFAIAIHINNLVVEASNKPGTNAKKSKFYEKANLDGFQMNNLDDYMSFCEHILKENLLHNAVCLKNSLTYGRSLKFEDVTYDKAKLLFEKPSSILTAAEAKEIQDFIFHWIIKKSIEYNLPIQIHTGYQWGNGNHLENSNPINLNNLFLQYPKAKFVLFHGGFPWTNEYAAIGKMFPNVYLDINWLAHISRETAITSLDVMFDCVPFNKLFWGGDCQLIEDSAGSLEFSKEVVSEVLSKRVKRGLLTTDVAKHIAKRIFRENAIEVFRLEEKTGIRF